MRVRLCSCAVGVLLAIHAGMLAYGAAIHAPIASREPERLGAGLWHWETGHVVGDRGNPPLIGLLAAAPSFFSQPQTAWRRALAGAELLDRSSESTASPICRVITFGRWALIPFSLLGGFACVSWARELYGDRAGALALALWCFSPDVLAYGQVITGDMAAAACSVAAGYAFWRWLNRPTWARAAVAGLALGLAQLTKFVCLILYPLGAVLWLVAYFARRRSAEPLNFRTSALQLALIAFLSADMINMGYGFENSFEPLSRLPFQSRGLGVLRTGAGPASDPATFESKWWGSVPVPLPAAYVLGIDAVSAASEGDGEVFLRGQWRREGSWYYYLYGWCVKLPAGTWLLVIVSSALALFRGRDRASWLNDCCVLFPLAGIVAFVSMASGIRYYRYILPALPFLLVWASGAGRSEARTEGSRGAPGRFLLNALLAGAAVWTVLSSLIYYPHSLSYFNELAGGPRNAPAHLLDSGVDLGQDLFYLRDWLDQHHDARPFRLRYWGGVDATAAGIYAPPVPAAEPIPGWHAISVTCLYGGCGDVAHRWHYGWLRELRPTAMAGYSIYIYHVTVEQANRLRRERGLAALREPD